MLGYTSKAPFEAAIAFATVIAAGIYLVNPEAVSRTAVGHTAQQLLPYWEALYLAGGLMVLYGLVRLSLRMEASGLFLLAAALAINALSIIDFSGMTGIASAATFAALVVACGMRVAFLMRLWRGSRGGRGGR